MTRGYLTLDLRMVAEVGCANPFVLLDLSVEEESEAGARMGSGPGARAAAESLRSHHCGERLVETQGPEPLCSPFLTSAL